MVGKHSKCKSRASVCVPRTNTTKLSLDLLFLTETRSFASYNYVKVTFTINDIENWNFNKNELGHGQQFHYW